MNYLYKTFSYIKNKTDNLKNKYTKIENVEIMDRVIWINKTEDLNTFSNYLNTSFNEFYKIWNISENDYDSSLFKGEIKNFINVGYPNHYLKDIFYICKEITYWIDSSEKNIAIIHCQNIPYKSVLILSCLLFYLKIKKHPLEAYEYICNLNKNLKVLTNNNKLYLKYFSCFIENCKLNLNKVEIKNIKISHIPNISLLPNHYENPTLRNTPNFLPYLQIFQGKEIIFNDVDNIFLKKEDEKFLFKIDKIVDGEILIRIRHFLNSDIRYKVFKLMINTGFLQQGVNNFSSKHVDFGENIFFEDFDLFYISIDVDIKYDKISNDLIFLDQIRNKCSNYAIVDIEKNNQNFDEVYSIGDEDDDEYEDEDFDNFNENIQDKLDIENKEDKEYIENKEKNLENKENIKNKKENLENKQNKENIENKEEKENLEIESIDKEKNLKDKENLEIESIDKEKNLEEKENIIKKTSSIGDSKDDKEIDEYMKKLEQEEN